MRKYFLIIFSWGLYAKWFVKWRKGARIKNFFTWIENFLRKVPIKVKGEHSINAFLTSKVAFFWLYWPLNSKLTFPEKIDFIDLTHKNWQKFDFITRVLNKVRRFRLQFWTSHNILEITSKIDFIDFWLPYWLQKYRTANCSGLSKTGTSGDCFKQKL